MTKPSDIKSCIPCYTGNSMFIPKCELFQHNQTDHPAEHFICDLCKMTFVTKNNLRLHIQSVHGETCGRKPKKMRSCPYCPVTFAVKKNYKILYHQHIRDVHNLTIKNQNTCGNQFTRKNTLQNHMMIHSTEKPFSCEDCGKSFKQNKYLNLHRRYMHDNNLEGPPFVCDICNKEFAKITTMYVHKKRHSPGYREKMNNYIRNYMRNKAPEMCPICGDLVRCVTSHMKQHTEKFECNQCGKVFARKDGLECHMRTHTGERPYECPLCGRRFKQMGDQKKHTRNVCSKTVEQEENNETDMDELPPIDRLNFLDL
uniref:Zinc finger protein 569 n=1 Tax=Cacopsylla melanoneura TaxID=428564 RepID=A0A8D8WMN2_9HEMI